MLKFDVPDSEINLESFIKFPLLVFRMLFFNFKPLGENAGFKATIQHYARMLFYMFCLVSGFLSVLQLIGYGFVHSDDFIAVVHAAPDSSTILLVTIKGMTTFTHRNGIWKILKEIELIFDGHKNRKVKFELKNYLAGYQSLANKYAAISILMFLSQLSPWLSFIFFGEMKFVAHYWYPFDEYQLHTFPFALLWVNWIATVAIVFLLGSDLLLYALVTIIAMEFDMLKNEFVNLKMASKEERHLVISNLIDRHNQLLELVDKLQNIFAPTFLFSFLISSFIICFEAFQLSSVDIDFAESMYHLPLLGIVSVQIWLLCLYGQKLIDSGIDIADGIYECDWEVSDDSGFKKQIILVILRGQRAKPLTAMKFADITLVTFTTVRRF